MVKMLTELQWIIINLQRNLRYQCRIGAEECIEYTEEGRMEAQLDEKLRYMYEQIFKVKGITVWKYVEENLSVLKRTGRNCFRSLATAANPSQLMMAYL